MNDNDKEISTDTPEVRSENVFFWLMLILAGIGGLMLLALYKYDYGIMTKQGVYTFTASHSEMEKDEQSGENVYYIAYRTEESDDYGYLDEVTEDEYNSYSGETASEQKKSVWTSEDGTKVIYASEDAKSKDVMNLAQRYSTQIRIGGFVCIGVGVVLYVVSVILRRRKEKS